MKRCEMGWNGFNWKKTPFQTVSDCFTAFHLRNFFWNAVKWVRCFNWKKKISDFCEMVWNDLKWFYYHFNLFQTISTYFNPFQTISTSVSDHFRPFHTISTNHFRPFQRRSLKWKNPFQPILRAEMVYASLVWVYV